MRNIMFPRTLASSLMLAAAVLSAPVCLAADAASARTGMDTQKLDVFKCARDYEQQQTEFLPKMQAYNDARRKVMEERRKNPDSKLKEPDRPEAPQNPVVYPEAVYRAWQQLAKERKSFSPAAVMQNAREIREFESKAMPAYEKALKEWKQAYAANENARKKDPSIPRLKLKQPERPKAPRRIGEPRLNVLPPQAGDTATIGGTRATRGVVTLPVHFHHTGKYTVYFQHYQTKNRYSDIEFRLAAPNTETIRFTRVDWSVDMKNAKPYESLMPEREPGFVWHSVDFNIEFPGDYTMYLALTPKRAEFARSIMPPIFGLKEVWVSNDPAFNPEKNPQVTTAKDVVEIPAGFQAAKRIAPHSSLNTVLKDPLKIMPTAYHQCNVFYFDTVNLLNLGATTDAIGVEDSMKYGMGMQADAGSRNFNRPDPLYRKYPEKSGSIVGRQADSTGKYRNEFADTFTEYVELCRNDAEETVKKHLNSDYEPFITMWWTAWEQCGSYDYGVTSVDSYRVFLEKRYGTIDKLNKAWHTEYKAFKDIFPAKHSEIVGKERIQDNLKRYQATANFIDFRDFSSKSYAERIALKTQAAAKLDPKKRHISSNLSCNNLSSVMWLKWRPLSFEDTAQITMKGSDMIGYDTYGTDDLIGANFDLYSALGDEKLLPMVREGSTHAPAPDLASRMQWLCIAKGMRGMWAFCLQESNGTGELQKFGLSNMLDDGAPRPKLAAYADNFRALHQLEQLLSETKRTRVGKPVAIYYSSICNVLQEKPYASIFDCGPDNFFRVYQLIRANGYPVTFITDRQIRETNRLDQVQAVFFIDASYIPVDVVGKVQKWVNDGGHIVCDAQPGTYDGHGFPVNSMLDFLGIEPVKRQRVSESAAEQLSFGYSAYAFDVINKDELFQTAAEYKEQLASTHPIAKKVGKFMVGGFGHQEIKCKAGEVLISDNNGRPAWVIRNHGKGTSSYFAGYLGTLYGSGCTQIEWRDEHADDSPYRFIDAYLEYIGMKKEAISDLEPMVALAMRFESPLVDAKGNTVMSMVSYNRHTLGDFNLQYRLPDASGKPQGVFALTNGSRKVTPIPFRYNDKDRTLTFRMPGFRVHGTVLAVTDAAPIVSVEFKDARRDAYGLADFRPGDEATAVVRVYNLSGTPLKPGTVKLRMPDGWFYDKESVQVPEIPSFGESASFEFKIKAPACNTSRRLRPVNFIYETPDRTSSPAVEMVWFQKEQQMPARPDLSVR